MTPYPYCANPDRDDNGNAISGSRSGNCQWVEDKRWSQGADAPCVVDNYGTLRGDAGYYGGNAVFGCWQVLRAIILVMAGLLVLRVLLGALGWW